MKKLFTTIFFATIFISSCTSNNQSNIPQTGDQESVTENSSKHSDPSKPNEGSEIVKNVKLQEDFNGAKVDPSDLLQGCFGGQDCIPSIDNPIFDSAEEANDWLRDEDIVFTIKHNDIQRAYPQRILNLHEIINDNIGGDAIAITFCPLCGSALAFHRQVDGIITEFGVSGKLYNSDLVMYDRYEGNLWEQITGEAIVGPAALRDEKLTKVALGTTTWGKWKEKAPNTEVLSRDTGFSRDYSYYPYGTYEENDELLFRVNSLDTTLQIKTEIYGIEIGENSKAYPKELIDKEKVIEDTIGTVDIKLEIMDSGEVKVTNLETGEELIAIRLFWFAWAAFHPDTELYQ